MRPFRWLGDRFFGWLQERLGIDEALGSLDTAARRYESLITRLSLIELALADLRTELDLPPIVHVDSKLTAAITAAGDPTGL